MKHISMKRVEALIRLESSEFTDSKAYRRGDSKEAWEKSKSREIVNLNNIIEGVKK